MSKRIARSTAKSNRRNVQRDRDGAGPKGVFVRALGLRSRNAGTGQKGADVGDRLQVKLVGTDPRRGYIDFAKV